MLKFSWLEMPVKLEVLFWSYVGRRMNKGVMNGWYLLYGAVLFACSIAAYADSIQYAYDDLGRLISTVNYESGQAISYRYDPAGNLTSRTTHPVSQLHFEGFSPAKGQAGEPLIIFGTGFGADAGAVSVTVADTAATVLDVANTRIAITIPGIVSDGPVAVTTAQGTVTSEQVFMLEAAAP